MSTLAPRQFPPTRRGAAFARSKHGTLSPDGGLDRPLKLRTGDGEQEQAIDFPDGSADLLLHALEAMAAGRLVAPIPASAEPTTVMAVDVLNVTRTCLALFPDRLAVPHWKGGKHIQFRMPNVIARKDAIDRERQQAPKEETREDLAQGMGHGLR